MRNKITIKKGDTRSIEQLINSIVKKKNHISSTKKIVPEILVITTFPPRECGIATYSQDLIQSLNDKFKKSFDIKICALDSNDQKYKYDQKVTYFLDKDSPNSFDELAQKINENDAIRMVLIQHEFGLFRNKEDELIQFLNKLNKSILIAFHTVLPEPNELLQQNVQKIANTADAVIVMTNSSENILINDYQVSKDKISVIPHGTHLVEHSDKEILKKKYKLTGRKILSTFGLLSSGKSIETTLEALPVIIKDNPEVLFLIIGKTHPSVVLYEGEKYRDNLEQIIENLHLEEHVRFVNQYLPLHDLLEYLQLTDVYLFTSKDPNQAVSGTFAYAISCGCPIISTPIPHACEVLKNGVGIIIDFENPEQLAHQTINLLNNEQLRKNISSNGLHKITPTAWENSAIAHAKLFENGSDGSIALQYKIPEINLNHIKRLTTNFGIIQFSVINQPDIDSGYTLDDNARVLIAMCQHYKLTRDDSDLKYINTYFKLLEYCMQPEGNFLNYVDKNKEFTNQNYETNLEDSNGRTIWALGYLISMSDLLPVTLVSKAEKMLKKALENCQEIHSTRAMAFIIKGLYYADLKNNSTSDLTYKEIARTSFDFLLSKIFRGNYINVISNKGWLHNGEVILLKNIGGEQPIDVAYTILALSKFYNAFEENNYKQKIKIAFNWFLGSNHLQQIIYNPCTGGCYDGLEENYINLNQGAESAISYLLARLTIEKHFGKINNAEILNEYQLKKTKSISMNF
jgi:glycosyltransferase involved in cell wall biosynthesis